MASWEAPSDPELAAFLKATRFCNPEHPAVVKKALELAGGAGSPREAAVKVFYFVRDGIRWYPFPQRLLPAEEVLKLTYSTCYNKANLQVALLRALKIPARYRYQQIRMDLYLKAVPKGEIRSLIEKLHPPIVVTVFAEAYLEGRWVAAATTFDKAYSPERAKDWNGVENVTAFQPDEIVEEKGVSSELRKPEIEELWQTGVKRYPAAVLTLLEEALKLHSDLRRFNITVEERLNRLLARIQSAASNP